MKDHNLVPGFTPKEIVVSRRAVLDQKGIPVDGLHNVWITLNNPKELNSYTTTMLKELILALREASNDRAAVAVVLTGAGTTAFCTGGNTREYAEVYAGRPGEYRQYMRIFNDAVSAVLHCDKPVICRVNGMRVGGGQEIGMACDYSISSDLALFSQAGPKHGSAPDGGSTDFLPLFVGIERAMMSATLCQSWSAHRFYWLGGLTDIVPALRVDEGLDPSPGAPRHPLPASRGEGPPPYSPSPRLRGEGVRRTDEGPRGRWVPNPLVITDEVVDNFGRIVIGELKRGADRDAAKALIARGTVDLTLLDAAVDDLATKLLYTMPDCLTKTIESVRKHKLEHWDQNKETNRAWLSLNMMTEANAGFRAFHYGTKEQREVDFVRLRQRLAEGAAWNEELIAEIAPWACPAEEVKR